MNILAKRIKRTAALEESIENYLNGLSDDKILQIARIVNHYDTTLYFLESVVENTDDNLDEMLSGMSPFEIFRTAFNSHDSIFWSAEWLRRGDDGNVEFLTDTDLATEAADYKYEIAEIIANNDSHELLRDLPLELQALINDIKSGEEA